MKHINLKCEKSFIPQENILSHFETLSKMSKIKNYESPNKTLSESEITTAGEMFIYLNACPSSFYVKLYWKAIYGPKSRLAMLASNIIKKSNDDFKNKAIKVFAKIAQVIGFQNVKHPKTGNGSIESFRKNFELDLNVTNRNLLQTVSNHPAHILDNQGEFSPSSLIPFCSFGEDIIGAKVKEFKIPVCNIFKPKIHYDQLCYETDLQALKGDNIKVLEKQLERGLTLVLDYNEERQIDDNVISKDATKSLHDHDNSVSIYLNTISIELFY